jgi:hypothetical protein
MEGRFVDGYQMMGRIERCGIGARGSSVLLAFLFVQPVSRIAMHLPWETFFLISAVTCH